MIPLENDSPESLTIRLRIVIYGTSGQSDFGKSLSIFYQTLCYCHIPPPTLTAW